jgi:hypothetical protein
LKNFKERCKDLEQELDQVRGFENNSIFGNTSVNYGGKGNSTALNQTKNNNFDFEVKKIKDMYQQQLTKAKEESNKY